MEFFARLSPFRAVRDLRYFLAQRQAYELWFLLLAIAVTGLVLLGFAKDSAIQKEYEPNIIYVQQWRLDRTDAEIRAQQVIDQRKKDAEMAIVEKRKAERRAQFKRLDEKLTRMGF